MAPLAGPGLPAGADGRRSAHGPVRPLGAIPWEQAARTLEWQKVRFESAQSLSLNRGRSLSPEAEIALEDVSRFRDEVQRGRERLFHASLLVTLHAAEQDGLKELTQKARAFMPTDPFVPIVELSKLNPLFQRVGTMEDHSPARGIIKELFRHYTDRDGIFVEQFQTTGFDARIWELYLHAYLTNSELSLLPTVSPDFLVYKSGEIVAIEAVTANPTQELETEGLRRTYSSTRVIAPLR